MIFKQLMDSFLIHYLGRFDKFPFNVEMHGDTYQIGEGEPEFTIQVNKDIPKKDLMASTSLALAEAYMRHDIEIKDGALTISPFEYNAASFEAYISYENMLQFLNGKLTLANAIASGALNANGNIPAALALGSIF